MTDQEKAAVDRLLQSMQGIAANATSCPHCAMMRDIAQSALERYASSINPATSAPAVT